MELRHGVEVVGNNLGALAAAGVAGAVVYLGAHAVLEHGGDSNAQQLTTCVTDIKAAEANPGPETAAAVQADCGEGKYISAFTVATTVSGGDLVYKFTLPKDPDTFERAHTTQANGWDTRDQDIETGVAILLGAATGVGVLRHMRRALGLGRRRNRGKGGGAVVPSHALDYEHSA